MSPTCTRPLKFSDEGARRRSADRHANKDTVQYIHLPSKQQRHKVCHFDPNMDIVTGVVALEPNPQIQDLVTSTAEILKFKKQLRICGVPLGRRHLLDIKGGLKIGDSKNACGC